MKPLRLVDSNYFIAALRRGKDPFELLFELVDEAEFAICGMVRMEVLRGVRGARKLKLMKEKFALLTCLPICESTWDLASELLKNLEKTGRPIPVQDVIIAACALEARAAVVTADAHFRRIPRLEVLTPPAA